MNKYTERGAYHFTWYKNNEVDWYISAVNMVVEFCKGSTLDLECGDGLLASLLLGHGYDVTGVDDNPVAIEMAKELVPSGRFLLKQIDKPTKGKWDFLSCINGLQEMEDRKSLLSIFDKNITKGAIVITHRKTVEDNELVELFKDYKTKTFEIGDSFVGIMAVKPLQQ
jgi:2-polyprenyl-3-methyl-5-hydroxy-6-metoxy-1,4-benzoquinol methylase